MDRSCPLEDSASFEAEEHLAPCIQQVLHERWLLLLLLESALDVESLSLCPVLALW